MQPTQSDDATFARVWQRVTGDPSRSPIQCHTPCPSPNRTRPGHPGQSHLFLTVLAVIFIFHSQFLSI